MRSIDLNADLGEGASNDAALFEIVSSANIACGAHAGDETTMRVCIALAQRHGVAIGAHPGFADRGNMGRAAVSSTPASVYQAVRQQVESLIELARAQGARVRHVKAHGYLYNLTSGHANMASALAKAVVDIDPTLRIVGLPSSRIQHAAKTHGLRFISEAFVDRNYDDQGFLVPREHPRAMVHGSAQQLAARALKIALGTPIESILGTPLQIEPQTLCVHGDNADAVAVASEIRSALLAAGIRITAPNDA